MRYLSSNLNQTLFNQKIKPEKIFLKEKRFNENQARNQITLWGPNANVIQVLLQYSPDFSKSSVPEKLVAKFGVCQNRSTVSKFFEFYYL